MMKAVYECDLHTHTVSSDGHDTPLELIDQASEAGLKVLAMTDHDVIPSEEYEGINLVHYAKTRGVIFIPGIEISCDTQNEDVHLVCLGCDWTHDYLCRLERRVQESKLTSYRKLVEKLQEMGMDISWGEVLRRTGHESCPEKIQKKQIFEIMAQKGIVSDWSEGKKLVQTSPGLQIKREKPDPEEVIQSIHETGGLVILAHPYLICEPVIRHKGESRRSEYISSLIDAGLDGIEVKYTYDKTSYRGAMTKEEIGREVEALYGDRVKILSGGSDYHGDPGNGKRQPRELGEEGITYDYFSGNQLLKRFCQPTLHAGSR